MKYIYSVTFVVCPNKIHLLSLLLPNIKKCIDRYYSLNCFEYFIICIYTVLKLRNENMRIGRSTQKNSLYLLKTRSHLTLSPGKKKY